MIPFGEDEGKSTRQRDFENLYITRGIDIEPILHAAFKLTILDQTPPHFRGRGYWANHMSWNTIGLMKERYGDLMLEDKYKRPFFNLDKHVRIYFKKLNNKYAPDNIITDHVRDMNTGRLQLNDDHVVVLYAGFRIRQDSFWDELESCHLVEMKTETQPNWVSDLNYLGGQMKGETTPERPIDPIIVPDEIQISGKKDRSGQAGRQAE